MSPTQDQEVLNEASRPNEAQVEKKSSRTSEHRKAKPSIDIELAQGFKERERLPVIRQGQDPETDEIDTKATIGKGQSFMQWSMSTLSLDSKEEEGGGRRVKRDLTTGRLLAKNGQSCLRCAEKGLRCTLHFFGLDTETRCAACRRSGAEHCVRPLKLQHRVPYSGPPWKDPNFTAGEAAPLPPAQLEEILREHFQGHPSYLQGQYVHAAEQRQMALPPFNHGDLPSEQRPQGWDWRQVLPTHMNRSLTPGSTPLPVEGKQTTEEDLLQFLRVSRRYQPRMAHLSEEFKGVW